MGLKRHPALQPFSRDHLIGLFHAQKLIKLNEDSDCHSLQQSISAFEYAWQREVIVHFADEDRLLGPLTLSEASLRRLHEEHVDLTALIERLFKKPYSYSLANVVGSFLDAHIRWEEHELFAEIESTLSVESLAELAIETQILEKSRHRQL